MKLEPMFVACRGHVFGGSSCTKVMQQFSGAKSTVLCGNRVRSCGSRTCTSNKFEFSRRRDGRSASRIHSTNGGLAWYSLHSCALHNSQPKAIVRHPRSSFAHNNGTQRAEMDRGALRCDKEVVPGVCGTRVGDDTAINTRRKAQRAFQLCISLRATVYGNEYDIVTLNAFVDEDVILGVHGPVTAAPDSWTALTQSGQCADQAKCRSVLLPGFHAGPVPGIVAARIHILRVVRYARRIIDGEVLLVPVVNDRNAAHGHEQNAAEVHAFLPFRLGRHTEHV